MAVEILVVALLVLTLNILDSVTTHLAFKQYPDKELKDEANPFMKWLMRKNGTLAEVVKQFGILALVLWCSLEGDLFSLRFLSLGLGLVVLNNTTIVVSRAITKRKVRSPIKLLTGCLHIPEKYSYVLALAIILPLAFAIDYFVWGYQGI